MWKGFGGEAVEWGRVVSARSLGLWAGGWSGWLRKEALLTVRDWLGQGGSAACQGEHGDGEGAHVVLFAWSVVLFGKSWVLFCLERLGWYTRCCLSGRGFHVTIIPSSSLRAVEVFGATPPTTVLRSERFRVHGIYSVH